MYQQNTTIMARRDYQKKACERYQKPSKEEKEEKTTM